jgi:hypothetical protein
MDGNFVFVTLADGMQLVGMIDSGQHPQKHLMTQGMKLTDPRALHVMRGQSGGIQVVLTQVFPTPSSQHEVYVLPVSFECLGEVENDVFVESNFSPDIKDFYNNYKKSIAEWSFQISRIAQPSVDESHAILNKKINLKLVDK